MQTKNSFLKFYNSQNFIKCNKTKHNLEQLNYFWITINEDTINNMYAVNKDYSKLLDIKKYNNYFDQNNEYFDNYRHLCFFILY
ncbi:hypothetical protein CHREV_189 [Choristoneura rosaceana entomopoxvirus 'L']|uniref:N1R/p28-like protein n=1 Tax=Choristoneura rosaceana entomopoxvirus 'L' TaxID=1293539 RepID=A0ABM9QKM7_9POXV|nr:hypothetical protein CHREV_189 [Choristoneura rosaceana entomopoxvirus 'L']CCU56091.1 hypothetical protein CHREV_189 [Choristoneura rosaceana entomopoxvirus 'L']